jgi:hypothetical protein
MVFEMFRNRLLFLIFGSEEEGVTGGWRELHNEDKTVTLHLQLSVWSATLWTSEKNYQC